MPPKRPIRPTRPMRALPLLAALLLAAPIACSSSSSDAPPGDAGPPGTAGAGGAAGSGGSGGGPATSDAAPDTRPRPDTGGTPDTAGDPFAGCTKDPGAGDPGLPTPTDGSDPVVGGSKNFTLEKALTAFPPGGGVLTAAISTELGTIVCRLRDAKAPITVANFIGLARGTRPFRTKTGEWKRDRFYDGLLWHRVIPGFVIQGGDPDGRGTGGPGYSLPNENHAPEPEGTLAMAASDVPSGSQFYIVVGRGPKPDYNVFGSCTTDVANKIAEVDRSPADRPVTPVHMQKIEILRCPEG